VTKIKKNVKKRFFTSMTFVSPAKFQLEDLRKMNSEQFLRHETNASQF